MVTPENLFIKMKDNNISQVSSTKLNMKQYITNTCHILSTTSTASHSEQEQEAPYSVMASIQDYNR